MDRSEPREAPEGAERALPAPDRQAVDRHLTGQKLERWQAAYGQIVR